MNNEFDIEKLDRRMPYSIPEGFFEKSYQDIMRATINSSTHAVRKARSRILSIIGAVVSTAAVAMVAVFVMQHETPQTDSNNAQTDEMMTAHIDEIVDNMSDDELECWTEYTDPDMYLASY